MEQVRRVLFCAYQGRYRGFYVKPGHTKTTDGKGIVAFDLEIIRILKEWKEIQLEIRLGKDTAFIFSYDRITYDQIYNCLNYWEICRIDRCF